MTTYYRASDFDALLAEFGVPVKLLPNGATVFGMVDRSSEEILRGAGAHALGERIEVTLKTDALALIVGSQILVDTTDTYSVREVRKLDDGAFTQVACMRVS